jgi:hypothetical protein
MDNAQKHNICIPASTFSNSPSLHHALSFLSEWTDQIYQSNNGCDLSLYSILIYLFREVRIKYVDGWYTLVTMRTTVHHFQ